MRADVVGVLLGLEVRENAPLKAAVMMIAAPAATPAGSRRNSIPIFFYLGVSREVIWTSNAVSKYFDHQHR
jgi:hypothetical protein